MNIISKQLFSLVIVLTFLFGGVSLPSGFVFAEHRCSVDPANAVDGHPCVSDSGGGGTITTLAGLLNHINAILNIAIPFIVGLAVFIIIFGVFRYIFHAADEEKRKEARLFITWGVVGVFMMLSIWGLVRILANTLPLTKAPVQVGSIFPTKK